MTRIQLYDFPLSGNCYKIRLMLSLLGLEYETINIDSSKGETQSAEFNLESAVGRGEVYV